MKAAVGMVGCLLSRLSAARAARQPDKRGSRTPSGCGKSFNSLSSLAAVCAAQVREPALDGELQSAAG